jgi:hypothetical protein
VSGKKTVWADRVDTVRLSDKPAVSLATADVSGNLPANALQWNTGALPTIGDATAANQTTLLNRLSAARAGYLDNLNVGGNVASQADVQGITQAQRVRVLPPSLMERPDSDSTAYRIWIYVYNEQHQAEDLDSAPTVTAENNAGTSRSTNLGTVTKPGGTTGQYYVDYTVASDHAIEQLVFKVSATEGTVTTNYAAPSIVVDTTAVDFTATDRSNLEAIKNKLPSKSYLTGTNNSDGDVQIDEATGTVARVTLVDTCTTNSDMRGTDGANMVAPDNAGIAAIKAKTDNLPVQPASQGSVDAIATILAGITSLAKWLRAFVRKDTPDSTALSEINSGGGAYSAATDSQEAIRDRGDAAWITGAGGSAGAVYVLPLQSTPSNSGRLPETYLTAYQGCKFQATFAVTDRGNTPVDLTGYDLDFVTWLKATPGTPVLTLSSTGATPALTISGEGNNQVTIDAAATSTPTAGQYEWRLYGDGEIALATGTLKIEAGAMPPTGG